MRQIVLDTETTGLSTSQGHRIIEVAGVEMISRRLTGRHIHYYLNPDRDIDEGAQNVHGISLEMLQDKPRFPDIAEELIQFFKDAELIIHNAPFDMGFLDYELSLMKRPGLKTLCNVSVTDTLKLAKNLFPGKKNNLDALCSRFEINNTHRTFHGALLDSELLAEVYLAMTRGQDSLIDDPNASTGEQQASGHNASIRRSGPLKVIQATPAERDAHADMLLAIAKECKGTPVWNKQEPTS